MEIKNAIKFMLISTLSFTLMNAFVKYLIDINSYQIVFFRSAGSLFFTFGYLYKHKIPILGNQKKLLILRGLVGVTSMTLFFLSIKYITLGSAVSLRYIAPIFASIFAVFLLKEKVKNVQWLFFVLSFSGVLVLKGLDSEMNSIGLILILISSVFSGLVYIVISKIGKGDHPVVIVNYFMVIATIVGGLLSIEDWVNPSGIQWLLLPGLGIFGYYGQIYMTKAFQTSATNKVAPLKYLEVIFTVLIGVFWFGEVYTFWSILGILMIIGGLVLNVLYKIEKPSPKSNA
jgi:drug/metabolite transporter (DMT)-like permease